MIIAQRVSSNGPNKGLQANTTPAADTTNYRPWRMRLCATTPRGGRRRVKIVKAAHRSHDTWPDVTRRGPSSRFLIGGALIDWPYNLPRYVDPEMVFFQAGP